MSLTFKLEAEGPYDPHPDQGYALDRWAAYRAQWGLLAAVAPMWTRPQSQPKTGLNVRHTVAMNLSAGKDNLCVNTASCEDTCVTHTSWRASSAGVQLARRVKTQFLVEYPREFAAVLAWDTERVLAQHPDAMARPNCNQDVAWEKVFPWLADLITCYDYTKRLDRVGWLHVQYRTTYSATSVTRPATVHRLVERGDTVTMVFPRKKHDLPSQWEGIEVVDGDVSDDRFNDPAGVIVGLSWKGKLKGKAGHPLLSPVG